MWTLWLSCLLAGSERSASSSRPGESTNTPHVRLARELEAAGEDVGQGTRVPYVIVDGSVSPTEVIHADKYDGLFDRHYTWNSQVYPALVRILASAYQTRNWKRWYARHRPLPGQVSMF